MNKKLTPFQKRIVCFVQKRSAKHSIIKGTSIAAAVFADTWKKNFQSHGRLVGRVGQECHRLENAGFLFYHGAQDQWDTFGASLQRHKFVCSNCKIEVVGAVSRDSDFFCLPCSFKQWQDPQEFAAMTDRFLNEKSSSTRADAKTILKDLTNLSTVD